MLATAAQAGVITCVITMLLSFCKASSQRASQIEHHWNLVSQRLIERLRVYLLSGSSLAGGPVRALPSEGSAQAPVFLVTVLCLDVKRVLESQWNWIRPQLQIRFRSWQIIHPEYIYIILYYFVCMYVSMYVTVCLYIMQSVYRFFGHIWTWARQ